MDEQGIVHDVIRRAPLFAALDDAPAAALRSLMTEVALGRGRVLFREGDPGDRLYVVAEGKIKLVRTVRDGQENLLAVLGPGQMFGELSLFDPGPRTSTAIALTDTRLLALSHPDLTGWLHSHPQVAVSLLGQLARRLRHAQGVVGDLVFCDVPGRLAGALLDLSQRFGVQAADGLQVQHDLSQVELAHLVGSSRESVNKALADFVARGWLRLETRAVVLLDIERLRHRAH